MSVNIYKDNTLTPVSGGSGGGMKKHLLEYDGTKITDGNAVATFSMLYDMLMDSPDFAVLVYNGLAYHPNDVSTEQIVFSSTYPVSGMSKNHRITMLKNGTITTTDNTDENIVNKTNSITDANKTNTSKYPSLKAVADYAITSKDGIEVEAIDKINADTLNGLPGTKYIKANYYEPESVSSSKLDADTLGGHLPTYFMPSTYSTSEQVIGTWVDGKNIYRKCFTGVTGWFNHGIDVEQPLRVWGTREDGEPITFPNIYVPDMSYSVGLAFDTTRVQINKGSNTGNFRMTIVLEYTKTTD